MAMDGSEIVLKNLIDHYCSLFLYDTARFFAERLFYASPKSDNLFLLAKCYRGQGKLKQVYHLLRDDESPQNRFHFAQVCLELGKYAEAQHSLLPSHCGPPESLSATDIAAIPGGAAGLYILGMVCRREHRREFAISYFQKVLELDKTCWGAYCELCEMGVNVETENIYGLGVVDAFDTVRNQQPPVCASAVSTNKEIRAHKSAPTAVSNPKDVLERRRVAERIIDTRSSPYTAASLGLSSLALRVGFATPGGMASPSVCSTLMQPLSTSMLGAASVASSHPAHSGDVVPLSAMAGDATQYRRPGLVNVSDNTPTGNSVGNALFSSPQAGHSTIHSDIMRTGPVRIPVMGRGGESGPATADIGGRLFGTPDSEVLARPMRGGDTSTARHVHTLGDFDTPGLTPIDARRLSADPGDVSTFNLQMSVEGEEDETMTNMFRSAAAAGGHDGTRRRVSFGPAVMTSPAAFSSTTPGEPQLAGNSQSDDEDNGPEDSSGSEDPPPQAKVARTGRLSGLGVRSRIPRVSSGHAPFIDSLQQQSLPGTRAGTSRSTSSSRSPVSTRGRSGSSSLSPSRPSTAAGRTAGKTTSGKATRASLSPPRSAAIGKTAASAKGTRLSASSGQRSAVGAIPGGSTGGKSGHGKSPGAKTIGSDNIKEDARSTVSSQQVTDSGIDEARTVRALLEEGEKMVLSLLVVFGEAYRMVSMYQCQDCIRHLQQLPRSHFSSGWVQHVMGKAHFELNDYKSAQLALREMLRLEPFRVAGTEILSTALWHLKREKELCALAQQVVEIDKCSPEAWCVVGNCFSLQQEHESAIKFFDRAIQVNASFTYARTLCGHEYVCNEDLDKATAAFRQAIYYDERHYNAWYGLGTIYYRQERLELAEYHFRRAISINPTSSVLQCYLGMVLNSYNSMEKNVEAIDVLKLARSVDPRNPQLHFQLAHILLTNGSRASLEEALDALKTVKEYVPKEPPVYALLGQVCYKLGLNQDAMRYFNTAIDLDHKQALVLKSTIDLIQDPYTTGAQEGFDFGEDEGDEAIY